MCSIIWFTIIVFIKYLKLTANDQKYDESKESKLLSFCHSFCHFLECLYDPYQIWRCFDSSQMKDLDMTKLQYSPSMLHVEVVPFIFGICYSFKLITYLAVLGKNCLSLKFVIFFEYRIQF